MSRHSLQPSSVLGERVGQGSDLIAQPREGGPCDLHVRTVLRWAGHYFGTCTCGWLSTGELTEFDALVVPCEVERALAESRVRRDRLYGR